MSESRGPKLLVLHGFTGRGSDWRSIARSNPQCRFIAPDLPGHGPESGRSSRPSMTECVEDIETLLDEHWAGEPVIAIGYSMGGRVLASALAAMPSRFGAAMLIGAHPGIRRFDARRARRSQDLQLAARLELNGVEGFLEFWSTLPIIATQRRIGSDTLDDMRAARLEHRVGGLASALRGYGTGSMPPVWNQLRHFRGKLWLTFGEEDFKYRQLADELSEHVSGAHVEAVPGAGHAAHLEAPDAFNELLGRFLSAPGSV